AEGRELAGGEQADARLIHVKTSGLVFLQKRGVAATDQEIDFEYGGLTGHAVGADYSSDTGIVVLHSAVKVVGLQRGQPATLTATRAELDRPDKKVTLTRAKYVLVGGARAEAGQTAAAERMVVHLRDDSSAERMEAEGAVTLTDGDGGQVIAPRGDLLLSAESRPQSAVLSGGLRYTANGPLRQAQGEAADGKAAFDRAGKLQHVTLMGAVKLHERLRASDTSNGAWSERDLEARTVELALASNSGGKAQLQDAKASGEARLKVMSSAGKAGHPATTSSDLNADTLTAHFAPAASVQRLAAVKGVGHTSLRRVDAAGVVSTSSGDTLDARFRPGMSSAGHSGEEISTAVQEGNVVMTQIPVKRPGDANAPQQEKATAARAVFDGATQKLTLTGKVQVEDADSVLWADRVAIEQKSGDAEADGSVKASYMLNGKGSEPVHVLAVRAALKHDSGQAIFYGSAGKPARLWQETSQVEAPVLQFEQKERRLVARGAGRGAAMAVHTVLVNGGSGRAISAATAGAGKTQVIRVASRELTYSDATRQAEFTGGVQVESADGRMSGQQAVVYLQAANTGRPKANRSSAPGEFMEGSVERIVATGQIEIEQPGRRATGERVVYTVSDGMFVMTGTAAMPPKIVDEARGTVTGTSLQFHAADESIVVSNGTKGSDGVESKQRVRTETRVKKER
ncbi:MAG TPA: LptA/OstA family protein, partial [Edaphobacter sp.]|nr:LptA/OstA family protein [Edaphobacter sp.]